MAWSRWGHTVWAWPVTISIAPVLTKFLAFSQTGGRPRTTLGRAIGSIWIALGIPMFLLFFALGLTGRLTDRHLFVSRDVRHSWHGERRLGRDFVRESSVGLSSCLVGGGGGDLLCQ